jgi:hypothetical protein
MLSGQDVKENLQDKWIIFVQSREALTPLVC